MRWKKLAHTRLSEVHVGLASVVLLGLLGMFNASQHSSAPSLEAQTAAPQRWHGLPDYNKDPDAGARMAEQLCRKANGDLSKLSAEELKWLDAVTAGNGARMVMMKGMQYQEEHERERKSAKGKLTHETHPHAGPASKP